MPPHPGACLSCLSYIAAKKLPIGLKAPILPHLEEIYLNFNLETIQASIQKILDEDLFNLFGILESHKQLLPQITEDNWKQLDSHSRDLEFPIRLRHRLGIIFSSNQIESISFETFETLKRIGKVDIQENPLNKATLKRAVFFPNIHYSNPKIT